MAIAVGTMWTADSANGFDTWGGGFDPTFFNFLINATATNANTNSPVISSASYSFVSGDIGSWIFIQAGTNWIPGWYKITSVSAGAATVNATVGAAMLLDTLSLTFTNLNTVAGCATVASPTGGTWSVDYSTAAGTQSIVGFTTFGAGTQINIASAKVSNIGNMINIVSGTNMTAGWYCIVGCSAGSSYTLDRTCCTGICPAGSANIGGALGSIGKAGGLMVGGNKLWASGTQTIASASVNVGDGVLSMPASTSTTQTRLTGFGTIRGDGTRPTILASGITSCTLIACAASNMVRSVIVDGANLTAIRGIDGGEALSVKIQNCKNSAHANAIGHTDVEVTGCSTVTPAASGVSTGSWSVASNYHDNSVSGAEFGTFLNCQATNNTGASSCGFLSSANIIRRIENCTAYGNGSHGISLNANNMIRVENCISYGNTGTGIETQSTSDLVFVRNCALGSNALATNRIHPGNITGTITLTADPFTNKAGNVYTLNSSAGGGTDCKSAGWPTSITPGLTSTAIDVGASQAAAGGGGGTVYVPITSNRNRMARPVVVSRTRPPFQLVRTAFLPTIRTRIVSTRSVVRRPMPFPSGINTITLRFPIISNRLKFTTRTLTARRTLPVIFQPITAFRFVPISTVRTRSRAFYVVVRRPTPFPVLRPFPLFVRVPRVMAVRSVVRRPFPFPILQPFPLFVSRARTTPGRPIILRKAVAFPILRPFPLFVRVPRVMAVRSVVRRPFPFPAPGVNVLLPLFIARTRTRSVPVVYRPRSVLLPVRGLVQFIPVPARRVGFVVKYPAIRRTLGIFPAPAIRTTLVTVRRNVR